jgi:RimJ/RimL family protein N-acetyltransferase
VAGSQEADGWQIEMIYGKRVRLCGVEKTDVSKSYEWINDPEVNDGLAVYLPMSLTDEEQWFENASKREQAERPLAIEARQGDGWTLIGNCGVFNIEWTHRAAELGIMIGDKSVWNKGYGTETMELLLQHGFETLNLNRIYLRVYSTNPRAMRVYEKVGFVMEGKLRQGVYRHGRYADVHLMSVLRSEWDARREGK